jgi:hypothetical protein
MRRKHPAKRGQSSGQGANCYNIFRLSSKNFSAVRREMSSMISNDRIKDFIRWPIESSALKILIPYHPRKCKARCLLAMH